MSEILTNVTRGPIVECCHRGDVVVVNKSGEVLAYIGDPYKITYIRSAAKPLQALNVILSGAAKRYNFTDAELSIMCGSHYGEAFHRATIENIMNKIGIVIDSLLCGSTPSIKHEYALQLVAEHFELNPTNSNCSGKHAGMLATCLQMGYSLEGYNNINHAVQKNILEVLSKICEISIEKIHIGIDGCTVPVHGMPLYNMALGFAKLSNPEELSEDYKSACNQIFNAMNNNPEMVAGTDGFCTELIRLTNGKLIGKLGAEGVYCIGVKGKDLGIAIKIEDGSYRGLWPAIIQCLQDLNILDDSELAALERFREIPNKNYLNDVVGMIYPVFHLKEVGVKY